MRPRVADEGDNL